MIAIKSCWGIADSLPYLRDTTPFRDISLSESVLSFPSNKPLYRPQVTVTCLLWKLICRISTLLVKQIIKCGCPLVNRNKFICQIQSVFFIISQYWDSTACWNPCVSCQNYFHITMSVLWAIIKVSSTPICMVQWTHLITTGGTPHLYNRGSSMLVNSLHPGENNM